MYSVTGRMGRKATIFFKMPCLSNLDEVKHQLLANNGTNKLSVAWLCSAVMCLCDAWSYIIQPRDSNRLKWCNLRVTLPSNPVYYCIHSFFCVSFFFFFSFVFYHFCSFFYRYTWVCLVTIIMYTLFYCVLVLYSGHNLYTLVHCILVCAVSPFSVYCILALLYYLFHLFFSSHAGSNLRNCNCYERWAAKMGNKAIWS